MTDTEKRIVFSEKINCAINDLPDEVYTYLEDYFMDTANMERCNKKVMILSLLGIDGIGVVLLKQIFPSRVNKIEKSNVK